MNERRSLRWLWGWRPRTMRGVLMVNLPAFVVLAVLGHVVLEWSLTSAFGWAATYVVVRTVFDVMYVRSNPLGPTS